MKKIIILDFSEPGVHVFDFDEAIYSTEEDGVQEFMDDVNEEYHLHLRTKDCQWMFVEELSIQIH